MSERHRIDRENAALDRLHLVEVDRDEQLSLCEERGHHRPAAIEEIGVGVIGYLCKDCGAACEPVPGICRICSCTEFDACMTDRGACFWVEPDLCSACVAEEAAPLALVSTVVDLGAAEASEIGRLLRLGEEDLEAFRRRIGAEAEKLIGRLDNLTTAEKEAAVRRVRSLSDA